MSGSFYRAFEDRYRGSRDLIKERLRVYLPFLEPLAAGGRVPALDLGCGRGEWLELLGEAGFAAHGVDLDEGMLAACRERGLDAVNGDAIGALRVAPAGSLAVVSAFHLVEHIAFEQVQELIAEALRALVPGGLLILETPNPENLVVGTSSFYDDPSHLRPLPPKLLAFAVEFGGFARQGVLRLQEAPHVHGPLQLFDVLAGASPDYAVVAQKGGAPALAAALDAGFAGVYGIDLHTLAQRYQQQLDSLPLDLERLRASEGEHAQAVQQQLDGVARDLDQLRDHQDRQVLAVQQQLAEMSAQIAHVHAVTVELAGKQAEAGAWRERRAGELAQIEHAHALLAGQLAQLEALQAATAGRAAQADQAQCALADQLTQVEANQARILGRLQTLEAAQHLQGEHASARMRSRIAGVEQQQQASDSEHARLAAHVAWIEGRLAHAEAEAAALRHTGFGRRALRLVRAARQRLVSPQLARQLRRPAAALLQRLVRETLRRPALKRLARSIVVRVPGLHSRLLRTMYAQSPAGDIVPVEADPLATQMSPRSLAIYRALSAPTKQED
ncbi:MAG: methyltransferase domain-containing protein [Pseudomonadota bacterium]